MSASKLMSKPDVFSTLKAASLPVPGPFKNTSREVRPASLALRIPSSIIVVAAKGVDLLEPLKPDEPAVPHKTTFPWTSVKVTLVVLKVEVTYIRPSPDLKKAAAFFCFLLVGGVAFESVFGELPFGESTLVLSTLGASTFGSTLGESVFGVVSFIFLVASFILFPFLI